MIWPSLALEHMYIEVGEIKSEICYFDRQFLCNNYIVLSLSDLCSKADKIFQESKDPTHVQLVIL